MRFNKLLLAFLFPIAANAQSIDLKYGSIGTAFKFISDTAITTSNTSQVVTFTSDSLPRVYRMTATTDTHLNLTSTGTVTPTATLNNTLLPAGEVEYFVLDPKTNIAALQDASGGKLYITKTTP